MKSICFVTTGDIKDIATAKRALGLANPLTELGWQVSIIMEDTEENLRLFYETVRKNPEDTEEQLAERLMKKEEII